MFGAVFFTHDFSNMIFPPDNFNVIHLNSIKTQNNGTMA